MPRRGPLYGTHFKVEIGDREIMATFTDVDSTVEQWVRETRRIYRKHLARLVVGFRLYRRLIYKKRGLDNNPFSILVLFVGSRCLIYQFRLSLERYCSKGIHKVVIDFLRDPKISFVGVDIKRDVAKLKLDWPVLDVENAIELRRLVERRLLREDKTMMKGDLDGSGLEELASALLGLKIDKFPKLQNIVGRWDWDFRSMDDDQLERAVYEAFLAFEIGMEVWS